MFLVRLFGGNERNFARDFAKFGFLVIFVATLATNLIAYALKIDTLNIETVRADVASTGTRTYTEVRSVLDDEIATGSTRAKLDRVKIDPCKAE